MTERRPPLPAIEWPEAFGPHDSVQVVASILAAFRKHASFDVEGPGVVLVLAPDPPKSARPSDWIREHLSPEVDLTRVCWGAHGLAYCVRTQAHFADSVRVFLSMHTTTLSILFCRLSEGEARFAPLVAHLVEVFLSSAASGHRP